MRQLVVRVGHDVAFQVGHALLDLSLRDGNAVADFDVAQVIDRDVFSQTAAELTEVHAILGYEPRHVFERHTILPCNRGDGPVDYLVGGCQANPSGALQLDFGNDQPLEDLFLENLRRGQFHAGFCGTLRDRVHLLSQLALPAHTFVDDGGNAVQKLTRLGEFVGNCDRRGGECDDSA